MARIKRIAVIMLSIVMLVSAVPFSASAASKAPAKPTSLSATTTTSSVTLKWKKVSKAKGYVVYKYNSKKKKYSKIKTLSKNTYKISKLSAGTTYVYAVKAYKTVKKKKYYSSYSSKLTVSTLPSKPTSLSAATTADSVTLKWKKVSGASGYVVYKYNSKTKKYSKIKTLSKNTYKISKLSAGTTYTYAVKAYRTVKKKKYYSSYSSKLSVSTLPSKVTNLKVAGTAPGSISLTWSKVGNASGYKLQYSTDKSFKKSVTSVTTTAVNKTISSLQKGKTYYFRVYAYRKVSSKTYTSSVSSVVSGKLLESNKLSTVSESTKYQTIEGFGASAAWWGHKVGGWDNAEDIIKYLYDPKDGIGLNIYRYNVGTGSIDDSEMYNYWQRTDGFIKSVDKENGTFTYDWNRDAAAQNSLAIAKKYAGKDLQVTLFSNSPPVQLTKNGKAYCSFNDENTEYYWGWNTNLENENYELYAQFECDVADHFISKGYNVVDVSPVNEPQYAWSEWQNADGTFSVGQEGCHYKPDQLRSLYKEMALKANGKPYKISMFESGAAEGEGTYFSDYLDRILSETINKRYYNSVTTHSYWANKEGKQACRDYIDAKYKGLRIACTEYCQMFNDGSNGVVDILDGLEGIDKNGMTIDFGVQMARVINEDLTILNATQWNWWTGCSNGIYTDGLVYINDDNHSDIKTSKRLWCLGNYSKFIKEGAVRVKISESQNALLSSAFKNPDGSLVAVYVNQGASNMSVNLNASGYSSYKVYETSAKNNLKQTQSGAFYVSNNISVPANAVVSVILTK